MGNARTIVITGGTDGIGRALAVHYLELGETVTVVGRSSDKGAAVLRAAEGLPGHARFVRADLSSVEETEQVAAQIVAAFPVVDALVFCARHYRSERSTTREGFEETFASFYLSRFVLGNRLVGSLKRAEHPIIVNVAGPGAPLSLIQWDNLQLTDNYHGNTALGLSGKLNDLLAVSFVDNPGNDGIRYLLVHPGVTATSFSGEYAPSLMPHIDAMKKGGKPISEAAAPIVANLDSVEFSGLRALVEGEDIDVTGQDFDRAAARRLHALTEELLTGTPTRESPDEVQPALAQDDDSVT